MKMSKKLLIPIILIAVMAIGTVSAAFLTYKGFVEIYGTKYPLGLVELDTRELKPIEGLEAGMQHIGEIRVYTYSPNAELVLQLMQVSHIVTNFRSFTVKVCLPLDIIYVVDLTASMDWDPADFELLKQELIELTAVLMMMNECPVQVAVVGFYDFPGETVWMDFETDYWTIKGYIEALTAGGGGFLPQSHYLGFEKAKELFDNKPGSWKNDKVVVFASDAESGFADNAEFAHAIAAVEALAADGVKIDSVLCGDPTEQPERDQLEWYAAFTGGHFIDDPARIVPGVTSDPTWIAKLTPITPFDSFRMKLPSSEPTQKQDYYSFNIFVDYFCKAVPWHEFFVVELGAYLEHAEIPPYFPPPPERPPMPTGLDIYLEVPAKVYVPDEATINWEITPGDTTPVTVTFTLYDPNGIIAYQEVHETPPIPLAGSYTHSFGIGDEGFWNVVLLYEYTYMDIPGSLGAFGSINVDP